MTSETARSRLGSRDADRLVPVDMHRLGPAQVVFVEGLPYLRVDDGARLLELRMDGSEESERAALRLAFSVWHLANVSHLERRSRGAKPLGRALVNVVAESPALLWLSPVVSGGRPDARGR